MSVITSEQTTAVTYALLASGAIPEMSAERIDPTVNPPAGSGGYSVVGALSALVQVSTRIDSAHRRAVITFGSVDLTGTYTTNFSGVSHTYSAALGAPANLAALLSQWAASITADAPSAAIVTATATATTLVLEWANVIATGIAVTRTGTGTLTVTTEYEGCSAYLIERANVRVTNNNATDQTLWSGWTLFNTPTFDGSLVVAQGLGARVLVPCPGRQALTVYVPSATLTGHADDAGSTGCTLAYAGPYGLVAPVVAA